MKRHFIASGDKCIVIEAATAKELHAKVQAFLRHRARSF